MIQLFLDFINSAYSELTKFISNSDAAKGALVLSVAGSMFYSILNTAKSFPNKVWPRIKRLFHFEVTIEQTDNIYLHFTEWLQDNHINKFKKVNVSFNISTGVYADSNKKDNLQLTCDNDYILIWYKRRLIKITSKREKSDNNQGHFLYTGKYIVSGIFCKNQIIDLLRSQEHKEKEKVVAKQKFYNRGYFDSKTLKYAKSFDKLFYDKKSELIEYCQNFIDSQKSYEDKGIFYQTGILLYGPAGTCKTATAKSLAKYFNKDIYILNIAKTRESEFKDQIRDISTNSIILIDDIDVCVPDRNAEGNDYVPLSTVLSFLDGPLSIEGSIVIATTNEIDKLDYALVRNGRFDFKLELSYPTKENVESYMSDFYDEDVLINCDKNFFKDNKITMVDIESFCLKNTNSDSFEEKFINENRKS